LGRKRIHLDRTKNGSNREIPMNKTCVGSFEALHARRPKGSHSARVFAVKDSRSWFEVPVEEAKGRVTPLRLGFTPLAHRATLSLPFTKN